MKLLSIETSTKNFSLAVSDGSKVKNYRNVKLTKMLSSSIIPSINNILLKSGIPLNKLDGFAVGLGPGSFTSLRVGLSTIKAFAFALKKPVVGIASLDTLAMNVAKEKCFQICTLCDAKRNMVFSCVYDNKDGEIIKKSEYLLTNIDEVIKQINRGYKTSVSAGPLSQKKGVSSETTLFVGDGIKLYKDVIKKKCKRKVLFAKETTISPQAKNMVPLALKRFKEEKFSNIDKLVPIYLYPDDCQVRK